MGFSLVLQLPYSMEDIDLCEQSAVRITGCLNTLWRSFEKVVIDL